MNGTGYNFCTISNSLSFTLLFLASRKSVIVSQSVAVFTSLTELHLFNSSTFEAVKIRSRSGGMAAGSTAICIYRMRLGRLL